jgi:hypothetical protein
MEGNTEVCCNRFDNRINLDCRFSREELALINEGKKGFYEEY